MNLDIWIDPACPLCWRTSRWLLDVASQRDLDGAPLHDLRRPATVIPTA